MDKNKKNPDYNSIAIFRLLKKKMMAEPSLTAGGKTYRRSGMSWECKYNSN